MSIQINREYFADSIKHRLKALNLSIAGEETAAAVGVHRATLWRVVKGYGCRPEIYVRICDWLGAPLSRFMGRENPYSSTSETLESVKAAIWADKELTTENKRKVWKLFEAMYGSLTT